MNKICIFGSGKRGKEVALFLDRYGIEYAFADNDSQKQRDGFMGMKVFNPEDICKKKGEYRIVIACASSNLGSIEDQLESYGLESVTDFIDRESFLNQIMPKLLYEKYGLSYMYLCQIVLTERCTLKCRKCAHGCYITDKFSKDLSLDEACNSADAFFSHFDMAYEFVLIGGEPLLYKDLEKTITYIGEKYRNRIHVFSITTNGTIKPSPEVLKVCKKYRVTFDISNYSKSLPRLKTKLNELSSALEKHQISYYLGTGENQWMDYGFETIDRKGTPEELKKVFYACRTPCHEIRGNRLYYCVMARSISDNLQFDVGKEDYLDLDTLEGEEGKETLLKFTLGEFDKGYLDMCNYCRGAEAVNYPIPAAEQLR